MPWFKVDDKLHAESQEHYVYHLSDEYRVLYVGYTTNPWRRIPEHRKTKPWFKDVTHVDVHRYESKCQALKEEAMSILFGEDLYNIAFPRRLARAAFQDARNGDYNVPLDAFVDIPVGQF